MSAHPKFPGNYEGVLAETLKPIVGGGLLGPSYDEIERDLERQRRAKIPALFEHFGIAPDAEVDDLAKDFEAAMQLVLALATKHVAGFKEPPHWSEPLGTPIEYDYWAGLARWNAAEFAALSLDFNPNDAGPNFKNTSRFLSQGYRDRSRQIGRAIDAGELDDSFTPKQAEAWADLNGINIPAPLRDAIARYGERQANPDDIACAFLRAQLNDGKFAPGSKKGNLKDLYQSTVPTPNLRAFERAWSKMAPEEARKPGAKRKRPKPEQPDSPRP